MPMTWGDALAAIVGERFGRHRYTLFGQTRSLEGSVTMLIVSALATWMALGRSRLRRWLVALITALGATLVEAISPWGIDNLTVPAISAFILAYDDMRNLRKGSRGKHHGRIPPPHHRPAQRRAATRAAAACRRIFRLDGRTDCHHPARGHQKRKRRGPGAKAAGQVQRAGRAGPRFDQRTARGKGAGRSQGRAAQSRL